VARGVDDQEGGEADFLRKKKTFPQRLNRREPPRDPNGFTRDRGASLVSPWSRRWRSRFECKGATRATKKSEDWHVARLKKSAVCSGGHQPAWAASESDVEIVRSVWTNMQRRRHEKRPESLEHTRPSSDTSDRRREKTCRTGPLRERFARKLKMIRRTDSISGLGRVRSVRKCGLAKDRNLGRCRLWISSRQNSRFDQRAMDHPIG